MEKRVSSRVTRSGWMLNGLIRRLFFDVSVARAHSHHSPHASTNYLFFVRSGASESQLENENELRAFTFDGQYRVGDPDHLSKVDRRLTPSKNLSYVLSLRLSSSILASIFRSLFFFSFSTSPDHLAISIDQFHDQKPAFSPISPLHTQSL